MTKEISLGGRPKGLCRGDIYTAVLHRIAHEGFQSYSELRKSILSAVKRQSSWRVLKKLSDEGLIAEARSDSHSILGWTLTPKGQSTLHQAGIKSPESNYRHPVYKTAYTHDLTLRGVKTILTQCPKVSHWIPEHIVKVEYMRQAQHLTDRERKLKLLTIPDALFKFKSDTQTFKAALELELTRKSKRRLRHKFESHLTSSQFDIVFFVVDGGPLLQTLWNIYNEVLEHSIEVKFRKQVNGIYFTLLERFKTQGTKAPFAGKQNTFSFS